MAEGRRSSCARAQHFANSDPLSKESISRTTRYRVLKRKRCETSPSCISGTNCMFLSKAIYT